MGRYKGQHTRKHVEKEFSYWVEIQNPDGGWWRLHDSIEHWHRARGMHTQDGKADQWHRRFCFADPQTADAFHAEFGGTRRNAEPPKQRGRS